MYLKKFCLLVKKIDFLETHKIDCTLDATHFTSIETDRKSFSAVAELNSSVPCKTASPVSPREGYPELGDYPIIPSTTLSSVTPWYIAAMSIFVP